MGPATVHRLSTCFAEEAARDIRMLAAAGALAPRAHEQLALLVMLSEDEDKEVAAKANATIARLPSELLAAFLARSDVSERPPFLRRTRPRAGQRARL
jgi:hypothetical protein